MSCVCHCVVCHCVSWLACVCHGWLVCVMVCTWLLCVIVVLCVWLVCDMVCTCCLVCVMVKPSIQYITRAMLKHSKASERMFCGVANH